MIDVPLARVGGGGGGGGTIELVPKTREGVWVCKSSNALDEYV